MAKVFWIILLGIIISNSNLYSTNSANLFDYNFDKIDNLFKDLTELETIVLEYNLSYTELCEKQEIENYNIVSSYRPKTMLFEMDNMDWSSFAWGFCCWPVGCLLIPFNKSKDDNQKLSYFYGFLTSAILTNIVSFYQIIEATNSTVY